MTMTAMTPQGPKRMTADEARTFRARQAQYEADAAAEAVRTAALAALQASDTVAIRCAKAGIAYPAEWQAYDDALRAVIQSGTGAIPERPSYPGA